MPLICDTGPIFAALDANDPDHDRCARLLVEAESDLIVPGLVLAEVDYWCHTRLAADVWQEFLHDVISGAYRVVPPTPVDLVRCHEIQNQYLDLDLGVVDASIVALAERFGEDTIATLDHRHFAVVRPPHVAAFTLVPD